MGVSKKISTVVISRNEGFRLKETVENLRDTLPGGSEILVVDDASTDGSTDFLAGRRGLVRMVRSSGIGVAKARNFGGSRTTGEVVIFADAHLQLPIGWWKPLLDALDDPRVGAVAPVIAGYNPRHLPGYGITFRGSAMEVRWLKRKPKGPTAVPILPGCTLAMSRAAFQCGCGGWDDGLLQRGNVDNEVSVRLWLLGYELLVVPEVVVKHYFRKKAPVRVEWPEYLHNRLRLAFAHFNDERLATVLSSLRKYPGFAPALRLVTASDIAQRRTQLLALRQRSDDWFFERFRLNW